MVISLLNLLTESFLAGDRRIRSLIEKLQQFYQSMCAMHDDGGIQ